MESITVESFEKLQRGTVVFINNVMAKAVKPQDIVDVAGILARDIDKGELLEYNRLRNTEDILIQGSAYKGDISGIDTSDFINGENVYLEGNVLVGEADL